MDIDFSLILVILSAGSGVIWLLDKFLFEKKRASEKEPLLIEYSKSLFPVFFVVLLLRSFLVEPFQIPSGSMEPTLFNGDFILVNKFAYGVRLPVAHTKIIEVGLPERGDVAVFRYPKDPAKNYIKRIVGLPGDTVEYRDKTLRINGEIIQTEFIEDGYIEYGYDSPLREVFNEHLGERSHLITKYATSGSRGFVSQVIPDEHYFVLGDNRDNSQDSRFWGFMPEANLVGEAFMIWMNFGEFNRIGTVIE